MALMSEDSGNIWRLVKVGQFLGGTYGVQDVKTFRVFRVPPDQLEAYHTGQVSGVVLHSRSLMTRLKNGGKA